MRDMYVPIPGYSDNRINAAYQFGQEDRLGSLDIGKIANMVVYDTDFLNDDIEKIPDAKLISTIVDGEVVYRNTNL